MRRIAALTTNPVMIALVAALAISGCTISKVATCGPGQTARSGTDGDSSGEGRRPGRPHAKAGHGVPGGTTSEGPGKATGSSFHWRPVDASSRGSASKIGPSKIGCGEIGPGQGGAQGNGG